MNPAIAPYRFLLWAGWLGLAVLGGWGVFERLFHGHGQANYGSYVVWGLWVSGYIYYIGLSAGAFLLSSLIYVFGVHKLERIGRLALLVAVITLAMALVAIFFDLGREWRFTHVFLSPNFSSMMAWMVWLYTAYFLVLLLELWFALRPSLAQWAGEEGLRGRLGRMLSGSRAPLTEAQCREGAGWLRALATVGVPLAVTFHGGVGALFGTLSAHPSWHTPLMPVLFLTGALVSGGGLMAFTAAAFWPQQDRVWRESLTLIGKAVLGLLLFDLMLEWAEFSIPMWYGVGGEYDHLMNVLFGEYWYVFWVCHILLGTLVPLALLAFRGREPWAIGTAGLLIAFTFVAVRLNIVIPALTDPNLVGLESSFTDARLRFSYLPSFFEWQVIAGIVALGCALFYLGLRLLPVTTPEPQPKAP
ncbi:MAG: polysulfide reductase NrfD [Verrucomicrobia bacterium]|nr:polysulfide reductase NrfD [Verrucomicrobiota bacterium]